MRNFFIILFAKILIEPEIPVKFSCSFTFASTIFHLRGENRLHVYANRIDPLIGSSNFLNSSELINESVSIDSSFLKSLAESFSLKYKERTLHKSAVIS